MISYFFPAKKPSPVPVMVANMPPPKHSLSSPISKKEPIVRTEKIAIIQFLDDVLNSWLLSNLCRSNSSLLSLCSLSFWRSSFVGKNCPATSCITGENSLAKDEAKAVFSSCILGRLLSILIPSWGVNHA